MTTMDEWAELYRDLHRNPELGFQETRTAGIVAERLAASGTTSPTGVGGTGVVGVLRNGDGPTVLLRADMDALPVRRRPGSLRQPARGTTRGQDVPVMHACGHDLHVTCLLGAARELAADRATLGGTVLAVFQPAEELGAAPRRWSTTGFRPVPARPDVVLGQHVAPLPAGVIGLRTGAGVRRDRQRRIVRCTAAAGTGRGPRPRSIRS